MDVIILSTAELGDRSYIVHDGVDAFVVDPQRDISRVLSAAELAGVKIRGVAETHIHNDYVTGGYELAKTLEVPYLVNADDEVNFERVPVSDGFEFAAGSLTITVIATPGHTPTHLSYLATDAEGQSAIFTGGSLLYGSVGRPDLLGPDWTDFLARSQFRSVHKLADTLADAVEVQPTHGFGSFCSSSSGEAGSASTIGSEKKSNFALLLDDEDKFKEVLLGGLDAYPAYYAFMGPANLAGPKAYFDATPPRLSLDELLNHIEKGSFVADTRSAEDYAAAHFALTHAIPLGSSFSTYLGWILPWNNDVVLVTASEQDAREATRQLARIGVESVVGYYPAAAGAADIADPQSMRVKNFAALEKVLNDPGVTVLDVRRNDERRVSRIEGSVHIPIHELPKRLSELEPYRGQELWVHCAGGYRATLASSILANANYNVVCVNDNYAEYVAAHA